MFRRFFLVVLACAFAGPALAEFAPVRNAEQFKQLVAGKTLTRPWVKLEVSPNGVITGKGARWDVTGNWIWRDGFFCRDLIWGGTALGYNCQEVRFKDGRIRFTSDKGAGKHADFRLD